MKPAPFDYTRPATLETALVALASSENSMVLAGGQSLLPLLNMRMARPALLVDIGRLDLRGIESLMGVVKVGALVTHLELEKSHDIIGRLPMLAVASHNVGHLAIRARGTIGGSLAHADPSAEELAAAATLDATVEVASPRGSRKIPAAEFAIGQWTTVLEHGDVITGVEFPVQAAGAGWGFAEFSRRAGDFALVGACALLWPGGGRLAGFGLTRTPVRIDAALEGDDAADVARKASLMVEIADDRDRLWRLSVFQAVVEDAVTQARRRMRP